MGHRWVQMMALRAFMTKGFNALLVQMGHRWVQMLAFIA